MWGVSGLGGRNRERIESDTFSGPSFATNNNNYGLAQVIFTLLALKEWESVNSKDLSALKFQEPIISTHTTF